MEDDPICVVCELGVRAKQQRLDCSKCQDTSHRKCTQMKLDVYRSLKKAKELGQWVCVFCKEGNNTVTHRPIIAYDRKFLGQSVISLCNAVWLGCFQSHTIYFM